MSNDASPLACHWTLDPDVVFLNHGSFGACPTAVLERQQELRAELERDPVDFLARRYEQRLDEAREQAARFVGADPEGFAFVGNATTGVNAVLRWLPLEPGDELVVTDHEYNACRNVLDQAAAASGAVVRVARLPFPTASAGELVERIVAELGPRTKLALLDHVTSPTGLVLPLETIVPALRERGVETLVDGAHAPGMLPLDVDALGAAYYAGNFHKWVCAPKGAAFLSVREDLRESVRPAVLSHGANADTRRRSRFRHEFDWVGTGDPTPALCVPTAIEAVAGFVDEGWNAVREHNHALAVDGRRRVADALGITADVAPESMLGSLATLPLPGPMSVPTSALYTDALQEKLYTDHRIEVPIIPWAPLGRRLVRLSAHLYNASEQYDRLGAALAAALEDG
jgi:isopenicillin-N epimerase